MHICDIFFRSLRAISQETGEKIPAAAFHTFLEVIYGMVQFASSKVRRAPLSLPHCGSPTAPTSLAPPSRFNPPPPRPFAGPSRAHQGDHL